MQERHRVEDGAVMQGLNMQDGVGDVLGRVPLGQLTRQVP